MRYFLKMHAIKQRSSDASRYHQAMAINSGWFAYVLDNQREGISFSSHPSKRERKS